MPGANCSIFGCTKSRITKGLAIFGIPKKDDEWDRDWREKLAKIIAKDRNTDLDLRAQIQRKIASDLWASLYWRSAYSP